MSRVPKTHPRIEAYGTVDELNALLGVALTVPDMPYADWLRRVQNDLFDVGADISVPHGGDRERLRARARADRLARAGLRRGQRDARAAEVLRAPRRHARRGPPARLPHGLPARRAPHDRLRRRRQPRVRPLPQPALRPALHPLPRRQRAATSRCGSRGGTAERRRRHVPRGAPRAARAARHRAPAREPLVAARRPARRRARRDACRTAPRSPAAWSPSSRKETAKRGLHGFPAAQGVGLRLAGLRNTAGDLVLERNQALRARGARRRARRDAARLPRPRWPRSAATTALAAFHRHWEGEIAAARDAVRAAAIALADDPDDAVQPAESLGASAAPATPPRTRSARVGEAFDGSPLGKAARKVTGRQPE